jgi:hypothetical protein
LIDAPQDVADGMPWERRSLATSRPGGQISLSTPSSLCPATFAGSSRLSGDPRPSTCPSQRRVKTEILTYELDWHD